MMEKRRQTIQNNLEGAEKEKQAATDLRAEYEEHLANARKEAQQIIENANRFSEKAKEEMITVAREEEVLYLHLVSLGHPRKSSEPCTGLSRLAADR